MGKLVLDRERGESITLFLEDGEILGTVSFECLKGTKVRLGFDLIHQIKIVRTEIAKWEGPRLAQEFLTFGSDLSPREVESPAPSAKRRSRRTKASGHGLNTSTQKQDQ